MICVLFKDEEQMQDSTENSTKAPTSPKKYLKHLKDKPFEYKKNAQSDSVSNLIADLHVELIYLFHKISIKLINHKETNTASNKSNKSKLIQLLFDMK